MRKLRFAAVIVLMLNRAPCTQAGVYSSVDPTEGPQATSERVKPLSFSHFQDVLVSLQRVGTEQLNSPERLRYLARKDLLLAKARAGNITVEERVNLSEALIRLRQYEEAIEILIPAAAQERRNFMVFANLATAHQLAGRMERAVSYFQQAKDVWPQEWPGMPKAQLDWYRQVERHHLLLVMLRLRQSVGRTKTADSIDSLFGGDKGPVHFLAESGQYEAGKMAKAERAKLPKDALAIVQQLVIWLPDDTRLYWLLGELYNAEGDVAAAAKILEDCVWSRRFDAVDLREHRKILQEAKPKAEAMVFEPTEPSAAAVPESWLPDNRKLILVGGAAGLMALLLAYLQIREMRRRRKNA